MQLQGVRAKVESAIVEDVERQRAEAEREREQLAQMPQRPPSGTPAQRARLRVSVRMQAAMRTLKFLNDLELSEAPPGSDERALPRQIQQLSDALGRWDKGTPVPGLDSLVRQFELYHEARKTKSHSSHFVRSEDTVAAMLDDLLHLQQATCDGNRPRNYSAGLMRTAEL